MNQDATGADHQNHRQSERILEDVLRLFVPACKSWNLSHQIILMNVVNTSHRRLYLLPLPAIYILRLAGRWGCDGHHTMCRHPETVTV